MLRFLDLPRQVLDGMIKRKLELAEARRLKLDVSNDEVARAVMSYPAFQLNGQFIGREKYEQALFRYGYTPERFEEELREDLLARKYAEPRPRLDPRARRRARSASSRPGTTRPRSSTS